MVSEGDACDENGRQISDLHGITLVQIIDYLVKHHGWTAMAAEVPIKCFSDGPSVKSSLAFLRRTPWARAKVEQLYIALRTEEVLAADKTRSRVDLKTP